MKLYLLLIIFCCIFLQTLAQKKMANATTTNKYILSNEPTGISGVYEVMVGCTPAQKEFQLKYWHEYGFKPIDSAILNEDAAFNIYGVKSALQTIRLQNGDIDSHGLLRLLIWEKPISKGVGYAIPETIGQRMSVMKTNDIVRIADVYKTLRNQQEKWLITEPFFDDPLRINKNGETNFFKRPVGVRENLIYGEFFNHVFFQRYGYQIPGYGTIHEKTNLKTSEFTHHDFIIQVDSMQQLKYLTTAFGLKAEREPEIDGDWLKGAKATFVMPDGYSHWYQGFVSPNNICGKLKFFMPRAPKPNYSNEQKIGALGITLHSFYTPKINLIHNNCKAMNLNCTEITYNEFKEKSFIVRGPEGASWQIIEKLIPTKNKPAEKLEFIWTND